MSKFFEDVLDAPPIEVFTLSEQCKEDSDEHKVNLTVGAYRTEEGKPWYLPVVKRVEKMMVDDPKLNKEYLPIVGLPEFCKSATQLLMGQDNPLISSKKADSCQTLGGTGALYLAAQFMARICKSNHIGIARIVGFECRKYKYWDKATRSVNFNELIKNMEEAPESSIFILHACAHNPTGTDLTKDQWMKVCELMKRRKLFPLFDIAYQGFASGNLDEDAWAIRYFANQGLELFAAQSFSKNFGLYNERIGNLVFVSHNAALTDHVKSQVKLLVRQTWSNPPQHGARIVGTILNDPELYKEWTNNVKTMAERVKNMRKELYEHLTALHTPGSWEHIINQIGMFSFTGITSDQVDYIKENYHIYMLHDGRINMCALNKDNVKYVAEAFRDAISKHANGG